MSDLEQLLAPLSAEAPCGSDLEYDPVFGELQVAGAGKLEQQFGDTVIPAKPPEWPLVYQHATDLAARTRDLRVAVWLLRSGAQQKGFGPAVHALQLLHGLLAQYWETVHPQLDAADGNDPLMRLSALAPLAPQEMPYPGPPVAMLDLRAAWLGAARGSLTVRDVELALGAAEALPGESVPTEGGVLEALRAMFTEQPELAASMQAGAEAIDGMNTILVERLGGAVAPDLAPLRKLLGTLASAARRANGEPASEPGGAAGAGSAAAPGSINSRDDVTRTIDKLCEWIERHEPSNPAPLLLRRAKRLIGKDFLEIMRDIAPEGLEQINRLAGKSDNE